MKRFSLDDFLTQATCAVLKEGQIVGTAWLLSADGYLLTVAHVFGKQEPSIHTLREISESLYLMTLNRSDK